MITADMVQVILGIRNAFWKNDKPLSPTFPSPAWERKPELGSGRREGGIISVKEINGQDNG
jgi:hypothetical protein